MLNSLSNCFFNEFAHGVEKDYWLEGFREVIYTLVGFRDDN